jgi:hypothetical protein
VAERKDIVPNSARQVMKGGAFVLRSAKSSINGTLHTLLPFYRRPSLIVAIHICMFSMLQRSNREIYREELFWSFKGTVA